MSIYYIAENGTVEGPFSNEQIVQLAVEKKLTLATLTANEGDAEWKPLSHYLQRPAIPPLAALNANAAQFYLNQNNRTTGPYSAAQMEKLRTNAGITRDALITREGSDKRTAYSSFVGGALLGWLASEFLGHHHASWTYGYGHFDFGTGQTYDYDVPLHELDGTEVSPETLATEIEGSEVAEVPTTFDADDSADIPAEAAETNAESPGDLATDTELDASVPEGWPSRSTNDSDFGIETNGSAVADSGDLGTDTDANSEADLDTDAGGDSDFDFGDLGGDF